MQLKKGLLEMCTLACINSDDSYGYKIMTELDPILSISESTLYPILKRLEVSNYVKTKSVEYNGRLRKYYSITDDGRNKLQDFLIDLQDLQVVTELIRNKINQKEVLI